jgi:creatinine amidohydrolase
VEKHGLHLPLGQDILQVSHIAYEASKLEPVCVFPDFAFGDISGGTDPNMGFIEMPIELRNQMLEHFCREISRNGYKKIILFNGHGGNTQWLSTFLRKLDAQKHDFVVCVVMIHLQAPHLMAKKLLEEGRGSIPELTGEDEDLILKYHEENMKVGHACFGETAYMLGIHPETVRMDRLGIESGKSLGLTKKFAAAGIQIRDGGWGIEYPNAFSGDDPYGCNERIGRAAVRLEAERLANAIRVIKEDEDLLRWNREKWARFE